MTFKIDTRKKIIQSFIDIANCNILEIGALDSPTYSSSKYSVKFLDFTSTERLARKSSTNSRYKLDRLVDVDFVCPTTEYSKYIRENFDLVIANHVIEHIPDTIRWLDEVYNILVPNGYLFLSVPDKRYTFDIARRNTNVIDVLRNYKENIKKPTFYHILEHFYFHKSISARDAWKGNCLEKLNKKRFEINDALSVAEKHSKEEYADVHCHVFTRDSFYDLISELREMQKCCFEIACIDHPAYLDNEFHVMLRKHDTNVSS